MEQATEGLRRVQAEIERGLAETPTPSAALPHARRVSASTRTTLSEQQAEERLARRRAAKALILRYREEKKLEPLADDELRDEVSNYLQHFNFSRIPTERLPDVYFEAMREHGEFLLRVDDFLRAWRRLESRSLAGHEQAAREGKPPRSRCKTCKGRGLFLRALPEPGVPVEQWDEVEVECPYCVEVETALTVR